MREVQCSEQNHKRNNNRFSLLAALMPNDLSNPWSVSTQPNLVFLDQATPAVNLFFSHVLIGDLLHVYYSIRVLSIYRSMGWFWLFTKTWVNRKINGYCVSWWIIVFSFPDSSCFFVFGWFICLFFCRKIDQFLLLIPILP